MLDQTEIASTLSDDNLLQFIEQGSPNPERGILYKETVENNGLIIFTHIIDNERKGMTRASLKSILLGIMIMNKQ